MELIGAALCLVVLLLFLMPLFSLLFFSESESEREMREDSMVSHPREPKSNIDN